MNAIVYIHIFLTWFFSGMSLLTLTTGYHDPVQVICAVIFALGAGAFALMGRLSMDPPIKIEEVPPSALVFKGTRYTDWEDFQNSHHYDEWLDDGVPNLDIPAYQRRGLDHDEQQ